MSTVDASVGVLGYDQRGNMVAIAGATHSYDAADRHLSTVKGAMTVSYTRDVNDRIVARSASGETSYRYGFGGSGDAADVVTTTANVVVEASYTLPGGVLVTWKPTSTGSSLVWSYPSLQGTVAATATATQAGVKQGSTLLYDPDGNILSTAVDNAAGKSDYEWHCSALCPLETAAGLLPTSEMGARRYVPRLGWFIEIDPVEGGTSNDYAYMVDLVNDDDLSGRGQLIYCFNPRHPIQEAEVWKGGTPGAFRARGCQGDVRLAASNGYSKELALVAANAARDAFWIGATSMWTDSSFACQLGDAHEDGRQSPDGKADRNNNRWGVSVASRIRTGSLDQRLLLLAHLIIQTAGHRSRASRDGRSRSYVSGKGGSPLGYPG